MSVADSRSEYGVISLVWGTNDQAGGGGAVPCVWPGLDHTVFAGHGDAIVVLPRGAPVGTLGQVRNFLIRDRSACSSTRGHARDRDRVGRE